MGGWDIGGDNHCNHRTILHSAVRTAIYCCTLSLNPPPPLPSPHPPLLLLPFPSPPHPCCPSWTPKWIPWECFYHADVNWQTPWSVRVGWFITIMPSSVRHLSDFHILQSLIPACLDSDLAESTPAFARREYMRAPSWTNVRMVCNFLWLFVFSTESCN